MIPDYVKLSLVLSIISAVVISGCVQQEQPIGGDRDEHGCLIAAGYSWCESKQKCLRTWEEECPPETGGTPAANDSDTGEITAGNVTTPVSESPGDAVNIAREYVKDMDQYKNSNGRNPVLVRILQAACTGCWAVDIQFDFDSQEEEGRTDRAIVNVTIEDWKVTDAAYNKVEAAQVPSETPEEAQCTKSDTGDTMTLEEARQIALASECVVNGTLEETSFCNAETGTFWIDLDIEKPGCNPACVVNIVTREAEINWRCTGLL